MLPRALARSELFAGVDYTKSSASSTIFLYSIFHVLSGSLAKYKSLVERSAFDLSSRVAHGTPSHGIIAAHWLDALKANLYEVEAHSPWSLKAVQRLGLASHIIVVVIQVSTLWVASKQHHHAQRHHFRQSPSILLSFTRIHKCRRH